MKNKYLYALIFILILSLVFTILKDKRKAPRKNSDFYKEIIFLKNKLEFSDDQIELAKKEYKRYSNKKDSIERRFRKYDIIIINDINEEISSNPENMLNYYQIAKSLNEERINHWIEIRKIANDSQVKKLDSIWSRTKTKILSNSD
ncbi:MAG: hypothetical protein CMB84_04545 [Flammeovirgaceae bacterium]|nr:hypothetical protein [Flammeovirgaceae bacterium]